MVTTLMARSSLGLFSHAHYLLSLNLFCRCNIQYALCHSKIRIRDGLVQYSVFSSFLFQHEILCLRQCYMIPHSIGLLVSTMSLRVKRTYIISFSHSGSKKWAAIQRSHTWIWTIQENLSKHLPQKLIFRKKQTAHWPIYHMIFAEETDKHI